jgi:hypothetical protein
MIFSFSEENCKGLNPKGLLYGYGWTQHQLFIWLYTAGLCNSFSTLNNWLYGQNKPRASTLIGIYKAYKEFSQSHPPKNEIEIEKAIAVIDW